MELTWRHLARAGLVAAGLHAALAAVVLSGLEPQGTTGAGSGGLEVAIGLAGGAAGTRQGHPSAARPDAVPEAAPDADRDADPDAQAVREADRPASDRTPAIEPVAPPRPSAASPGSEAEAPPVTPAALEPPSVDIAGGAPGSVRSSPPPSPTAVPAPAASPSAPAAPATRRAEPAASQAPDTASRDISSTVRRTERALPAPRPTAVAPSRTPPETPVAPSAAPSRTMGPSAEDDAVALANVPLPRSRPARIPPRPEAGRAERQPRPSPPQTPTPTPASAPDPAPSPLARRQASRPGKADAEPEIDGPDSSPSGGPSTGGETAALEPGGGAGETPTAGGSPGARQGYIARIAALLARHKRYPARARMRRLEGVGRLAFAIHADGRIADARLARSTGHRLLDREVLEMLDRVGRMPPIPDDLGTSRLEIEVPVKFALR